MLRACVRTVSTPIESVWAIWALAIPCWSSSSTSASRAVRMSGSGRSKRGWADASGPSGAAGRGRTRIPREERWIALMMSRPCVSLEMQAVAPNERI